MTHSSAFFISKLSPDERAALRPLLQNCWKQTYEGELGEQITAKLLETLKSDNIGGLVPATDETVHIARQGDHILGCAVSAARHGVTYIWGCYVLPDFQRKGIGRRLLRRSITVHDRANSVQLIVLKSSISAIKFYQTLGFKIRSEDEFELLPGHQVPSMTMSLTALNAL